MYSNYVNNIPFSIGVTVNAQSSEPHKVHLNPIHVNPNFTKVHVNPNFKRNVHINPNFKSANVHVNPSIFPPHISQPQNVISNPCHYNNKLYNKPIISTKTKLVRVATSQLAKISNPPVVNKSATITNPYIKPTSTTCTFSHPQNIIRSKYKLVKAEVAPKSYSAYNFERTKSDNKFKLDNRVIKSKYKLASKAYLMSLNPQREIIKRPRIKSRMVKMGDRIYHRSPRKDLLHSLSNGNKYKKVNATKITCAQKDLFTSQLKQIAVPVKPDRTPCIRFLQGDCFDNACKFSHISIGSQPLCRAFLEGTCKAESCKFSHLKFDTDICKHYLRGTCMHGTKCNKRHAGRRNAGPKISPKKAKIVKKLGCVFRCNAADKTLTLLQQGDYMFKKVVIAGVQYVRKNKTIYVAVPNARNKVKINTKILKKDNNPCNIYRKTGKCVLKEKGKCFKKHNPDQISICTRFLQGDCHKTDCQLSHKVSQEKMPTCKFYLEGMCHRNNCQYLHVKLNAKASICKDFLAGYCQKGLQCDKRHQFLCPNYELNASCPLKKCPYPHGPAVRQYRDTILNKIARNTKQKSVKPVVSTEIKTDSRYYLADEKSEVAIKSVDAVIETVEITSTNCDTNECDVMPLLSSRPRLGLLPAFIPLD